MPSATSAAKAMPAAPMDLVPLGKRPITATRFAVVAARQPVSDEALSAGGHPPSGHWRAGGSPWAPWAAAWGTPLPGLPPERCETSQG
jgi:hypothetical protein